MFQFTHPGRGATILTTHKRRYIYVSIHAPREGCDKIEALNSWWLLLFQFTHPGRGATGRDTFEDGDLAVSIHAPREGCDLSAI